MATTQTIIPPTEPQDVPVIEGNLGSLLARFVALVIDMLIIKVVFFIIFIPLGLVASIGTFLIMPMPLFFFGGVGLSFVATSVVAAWLYFAVQESSARGATIGKRIMGLRVVDENGRRLTFSLATLRYAVKIISMIPMMLGFFLAFFTSKRQALHDLIANTVVIKVS
ncbi:MAG: RDD family protein [Bdellovibrionales bacterium]|jgi:uncharacterized RDD family membrane protein YckC